MRIDLLAALFAAVCAAPALAAPSQGAVLAFRATGPAEHGRAGLASVQTQLSKRSHPAVDTRDMAHSLVQMPSACEDSFLVFELDDFHAHSLSAHPSQESLKQKVLAAGDDVVGAPHSHGRHHLFKEMERALANRCSASAPSWTTVDGRLLASSSNQGLSSFLPSASSQKPQWVRVTSQSQWLEDGSLGTTIDQFASLVPGDAHIILAASARPKTSDFHKRSLVGDNEKGTSRSSTRAAAPSLFRQYQFFTSDHLLAAVVVSVLFVPVIWVFISLLSDIQTPDRLGEKSALTQMSKKAQ